MKNYTPIGIFDSGFGGLTVFKAIARLLPDYDYLYLGDNARAPYGSKSFDQVYKYAKEGVKYLMAQGCELVVLACNTASAKALRQIQQKDLPKISPSKRVLGVIRPTAEVIGKYSDSKEIGIMATKGTVESESYLMEIRHFFPDLKVHQQACPIWVPLIENGEWDNPGGDFFVGKYIKQLSAQSSKIDAILLGCTHYPVLREKIKSHLAPEVKVITQGEIIAKSLQDYLKRHQDLEKKCTKNGQRIFLTTGYKATFDQHAPLFFGEKISSQQVVL